MKLSKHFFLAGIAATCATFNFGCASTQTSTQNREGMLVAAGFKTITPKTAAQKQKLQNLPPGKVTMIKKGSKTYYIFPDSTHNQAYIGGPSQYEQYQQLRAENKLAKENVEMAEMDQDAAMEWSMWDGWDAGAGSFGPMAGAGPD
jgi:hypothetical protein